MVFVEWNNDPTPRQLRWFGSVWTPLFCAGVGLWLYVTGATRGLPLVLWGVGGLSLLVGWWCPARLRGVYRLAMRCGFPIGWLIAYVLLAAIFFLMITPVGLLMRLCGRDPLGRRWLPSRSSYWGRRKPSKDVEQYFRQF